MQEKQWADCAVKHLPQARAEHRTWGKLLAGRPKTQLGRSLEATPLTMASDQQSDAMGWVSCVRISYSRRMGRSRGLITDRCQC